MKSPKGVAEPDHLNESPSVTDVELMALRERVAQLDRLAAIGQLTAGILHEIKNPLTFITNYARLSVDLVGEMESITVKLQAQFDPDELLEVLEMLKGNVSRIRENGARAERIIKGMLAQIRSSESVLFEQTDLNILIEEFSKLAYQGMRAGDNQFNVTLTFQLDPAIGSINIAPYEFNRVILNLVLNACYAVNERRKTQPDTYKPTIVISSHKVADAIEIKIRDNGDGIPEEVKKKLFMPFFTTKPVGVGTGLGLSLSHDIINGLHKGQLNVDSEPGIFTEFSIRLPLD